MEESLDIITQLATSQGYTRVNFGSNASNNNRTQLPPPYNAAVHRMSWKGSEESLNSPKRAESPMMAMENAVPMGHPPLKSTVTSVSGQASGRATSTEATRAEWHVQRNPALVAPQPWQGPHMPAHPPQQRYVERT